MIAKVWRFLRKTSMMELSCMPTVSRPQLFKKENSPHIFSPVSKSSCLKKNILRKKVKDGKYFNKVEPLQYKVRNFIKNRAKQSSC